MNRKAKSSIGLLIIFLTGEAGHWLMAEFQTFSVDLGIGTVGFGMMIISCTLGLISSSMARLFSAPTNTTSKDVLDVGSKSVTESMPPPIQHGIVWSVILFLGGILLEII